MGTLEKNAIPRHRHGGTNAFVTKGQAGCWASHPLDAMIQAWVLVLLAVLPLMISPLANFAFEGTKAFLLHAFALFGGLLLFFGWLRDLYFRRGDAPTGKPTAAFKDAASRWLLPFAALAVAIQGVATIFAVQRDYALYGTPGRGGGLWTYLSLLVLCAGVWRTARTRKGRQQVLEALALGSLAPAWMGIMQHFGVDPLELGGATHGGRVAGTFGNPIFLGGYLAIMIPLTLGLAWEHFTAGQRQRGVWSVLVLWSQVAALWFTGSRGPLGALAGALLLTLPAGLLAKGRRRAAGVLAATGLLGIAAAVVGFHLLVVRPFQSDADGRPRHGQHRFLSVRSVLVRLNIYEAIADTMTDFSPLKRCDRPEAVDPWAPLRPWIGFGPQNLRIATARSFPGNLERLERGPKIIDAAHNHLLEIWADAGWLGVGSWLLLLGLLLSQAAKGFYWRRDRTVFRREMLLWFGGMAAAAMVTAGAWGIWAWPLGLACGAAAGWLLLVLVGAFRNSVPTAAKEARFTAVLPLALFAAVLTHLLDGQSNVVAVASSMVFWGVIGLVSARPAAGSLDCGEAAACSPGDRWRDPVLLLIVGVTLYLSMATNPLLSASVWKVAGHACRNGVLPLVAGLLLAGGLLTGFNRRWLAILMLAAVAVGLWNWKMAVMFGTKLKTEAEVLDFGHQLAMVSGLRLVWLALGVVVLGCFTFRTARLWTVAGALMVFGVTGMVLSGPRSGQQAAAFEACATFLEHNRQDSLAARCLDEALGRSPWDDMIHLRRHMLFGKAAERAQSPQFRDRLMMQSVDALREALRLSPYDPRNAERLGMVYNNWAGMTSDRRIARVLGQATVKWLNIAADNMPRRGATGLMAVDAIMRFKNDTPRAEQRLRTIAKYDPPNARAAELLAYLCHARSRDGALERSVRKAAERESSTWARRALESPARRYYRLDDARLMALMDRERKTLPAQ